MALERPAPPKAIELEASEGLRRSAGTTFGIAAGGGAPPALSYAHHLFTLNRRDILAGAGLGAAKEEGWGYLAGPQGPLGGAAPSPAVLAVVAVKNGVPSFTHRQEGWLARKTRETIDLASQLPEVQSGSYELRMLRLPSVQLTDAVWLKNKGRGEDIVIPIASKSKQLVAGRKYTADDFLNVARGLAKESVFDNSPRSELTSGA